MQGLGVLNYKQFIIAIFHQIRGSDLSCSTIRGTGFGREIFPTTGRLQGPTVLVQVVAVTEIVRPRKARIFKFTLSDGEREIEAVARMSPHCSLNFDTFALGYKVSYRGPELHASYSTSLTRYCLSIRASETGCLLLSHVLLFYWEETAATLRKRKWYFGQSINYVRYLSPWKTIQLAVCDNKISSKSYGDKKTGSTISQYLSYHL